MLKLRGLREEIDAIEKLITANKQSITFHDNECNSDSGKDYRDIICENYLPAELFYEIKKQFPEIKLYAYRVDPMSNIPIHYYSLPGSDVIKEKWSGNAYNPANNDQWWEKDKDWYTKEKPDGTVCITRYCKWEKEVFIPESIDGKKVTELGPKLFYGNPAVEAIYVKDNIKKAPASAFSSCRKLLVYSDNDAVNKTLKKSHVSVVTKEDNDESIAIKKEFNYTVSDDGVTITAYKGNGTDVSISPIIEGKNVVAVAKDTFLYDKFEGYGTMNCVIFPITVKTFEEKCFHAVDAKYLAAPGIDFTLVSSKLWKNRLVKGFIAKETDGIYTDENIRKKYLEHLKRSFKDYIDDCLNDEVLFRGLLKSVPLSSKQTEVLFNRANELHKNEEKIQIMNYQDKCLKSKSRSAKQELTLDKPVKPLSKSAIKKLYAYDIKSDGTVNIKSYKGEEREVIIPDLIEGMPVTSIGDWAFYSFVSRDTPQVIKIKEFRRRIETIHIPATVTEIGKHVFDGCGCENDGSPKYDWRAEYNTRIEVLNEKYPALVKLLVSDNSPAMEYAISHNIQYETY